MLLKGDIGPVSDQEDAYLCLYTFYGKWFMYPATVGNGRFECPITIGTEADVGQIFKIEGRLVPTGTTIKIREPLDQLPQGKAFWRTTSHRRV
jgi:hypothetical protein